MRRGWEDFVRSVIADSIHDADKARELYGTLRLRPGMQAARGLFSVDASERVTKEVRNLVLGEIADVLGT